MKTMLVRRNRPNIFVIAGVRFFPGITEVRDKDIDTVKSHKSWKAQLEAGVMEEVTADDVQKKGKTTDIAEMSANDAIKVIRETYAIPVLQDMHQRETDKRSRSSVLKACLDQIEEIKKPPEKKDKDKE